MSDKLSELAESVKDEESFLLFVKELIKDRKTSVEHGKTKPSSPNEADAGGWENNSIENFLEGAAAWAEDSNFGRRMAFPEYELKDVSEWRRFAAFLMAGKVYE